MCGRVEIARRASIASRRTTDSEAVSVGSGCEQRSHLRETDPDGLSQSAKLSALGPLRLCVGSCGPRRSERLYVVRLMIRDVPARDYVHFLSWWRG